MSGPMSIDQAMDLAHEHRKAGRSSEAEQICRELLKREPGYAQAMHLMGLLAVDGRRMDVALDWLGRAVTADPSAAVYHRNRGSILAEVGRLEEAIESLRRAIALSPDAAEPNSVLASVLMEDNQYVEAASAARQAISLQPEYAEAWANLGMALRAQGKLGEAIDAYQQAAKLRPDWAIPQFGIGAASMLRGDFRQGWKYLEWRRRDRALAAVNWKCPRPQWDGSDIRGRTIFLHTEQGFGDAIQFVRFVPIVAERGAKIILGVPPELVRLMKDMPGVSQCVTTGQPILGFDVYCPLMTLPMIFGTEVGTIPARVPYLSADIGLSSRWNKRVTEITAKRKIGLVWRGRPTHVRNLKRSIPTTMLSPLFAVPNGQFISLQKGSPLDDESQPVPDLLDWTSELTDFADTASLIDNLDLVITVDTAVAHLAGAMAKPVWLMLQNPPDWRWMLDRTDSPWYPSMRIFRQPVIGDWKSVIDQVARELAWPAR